jgi:predicted transcriptional regulator
MISDQLRDALIESGLTAYAIGKSANVDPSAVKKFIERDRGLSLDTFDPLCELMGLVLAKREAAAERPADFNARVHRHAHRLVSTILKDALDRIEIEEPASPEAWQDETDAILKQADKTLTKAPKLSRKR